MEGQTPVRRGADQLVRSERVPLSPQDPFIYESFQREKVINENVLTKRRGGVVITVGRDGEGRISPKFAVPDIPDVDEGR